MAATATRTSNSSPTNSRMSSPKDFKKAISTKVDEPLKVEAPSQEQRAAPPDENTDTDAKPPTTTVSTTNAQPLAPPPRPTQTTTGDTPDYFNTVHNPFSLEPNVFEESFRNPSIETPGRTILPPVANITSPSPLPGITPGWQSLRSGPLSPAMLTGPTGQSDYFSESFRGFPTPNESSLRTGLTPGGGGSMFPAPSPSTQAIFNLQSGGVTPSTAEFQQSALRAAAQKQSTFPPTSAPASQAQAVTTSMDRPGAFATQAPSSQPRPQDLFQQDVNTAASDLLSFATQNGNRNGQQPFTMGNQPAAAANNLGHMPVQPVQQDHGQGRRDTKASIGSIGSIDTADMSDSDHEPKAVARNRGGKKGGNSKATGASRRKAEDTPKGSNKKSKTNNGTARSVTAEEESSEATSPKAEEETKNGRKMTDEEKRKNFLERNRVAALKCRQRKKQWLANLQAKVELFSTENDALSQTVAQLREEIVNLKTLLLAHKECPVSAAQGIGGANMNVFLGGELPHQHPYGMGMQPNGVQMPVGMPMQSGAQLQRYGLPMDRQPGIPGPRIATHIDS